MPSKPDLRATKELPKNSYESATKLARGTGAEQFLIAVISDSDQRCRELVTGLEELNEEIAKGVEALHTGR